VGSLTQSSTPYAPAPLRRQAINGRPRVQGKRLPPLQQILQEARTICPRGRVR
jgi:hypothetical protein